MGNFWDYFVYQSWLQSLRRGPCRSVRGVGLPAGGSKFDVFWWARWGVVLGAKLAMTLFCAWLPFGRPLSRHSVCWAWLWLVPSWMTKAPLPVFAFGARTAYALPIQNRCYSEL